MSASERLKALEAKVSGFRPYEELWDALPQIVAVVEAAQRRVDWCEACAGAGWDLARADGGHQKVACEECWPERRALAALEEALS